MALQTPSYSALDEVSTVLYMGAALGLSQAPGWAKEVLKRLLQRLFSLSCLSFPKQKSVPPTRVPTFLIPLHTYSQVLRVPVRPFTLSP